MHGRGSRPGRTGHGSGARAADAGRGAEVALGAIKACREAGGAIHRNVLARRLVTAQRNLAAWSEPRGALEHAPRRVPAGSAQQLRVGGDRERRAVVVEDGDRDRPVWQGVVARVVEGLDLPPRDRSGAAVRTGTGG